VYIAPIRLSGRYEFERDVISSQESIKILEKLFNIETIAASVWVGTHILHGT